MKISVITVCYNSAATIEDTLKSVMAQDHTPREHIVVDGGSDDGTLDIIHSYREHIARIISEPDDGIYDAMNKGIRCAGGDVIGCLNADDFYADNKVLSRIAVALTEPRLQAVYGDLVYVDQDMTDQIVRYWQAGEYIPGAFARGWVPPHPTFFCRRELFDRFGYYRPDYRIAADFELMLRFMEKYRLPTGYLPHTLVCMRIGGRANRIGGIIRGNLEIIRSFKNNDLDFPWRFFIHKPLLKLAQLANKPSTLSGK